MLRSKSELAAILKEHLRALAAGTCSLTAEQVQGEQDPEARDVLREDDVDTGTYRALPSLLMSVDAGHGTRLAQSVVSYVARTQKSLVLRNATDHQTFGQDAHVRALRPRSLLAAPIARHGELVGVISLEKNLIWDARSRPPASGCASWSPRTTASTSSWSCACCLWTATSAPWQPTAPRPWTCSSARHGPLPEQATARRGRARRAAPHPAFRPTPGPADTGEPGQH